MHDYDCDARRAVLPPASRGLPGRSDSDLCRLAGLSPVEIESLFQRAHDEGEHALVLLCRDRGVGNVGDLIP